LRGATRRSNPSGGGCAFRALVGKPPHHRRAPLRPHFVASYPPQRGASPPQRPPQYPTACPGAPPALLTAASRKAAWPKTPDGLLPRVSCATGATAQRQAAIAACPPDRGWFCWSTDYTDYEEDAHLNLCNLRNLWTVRIDHAIQKFLWFPKLSAPR
jgi:hypothetical protein